MEGLAEWQRPLDPVYAVIFIDAINVKIREGQVANRPIYLALGVTADGERDVLGLWAGEHGDGREPSTGCGSARKSRTAAPGTAMVVCDGLKGLPDAVMPSGRRPSCKHVSSISCGIIQVRVEKGLGADRERPQAGLHRRVRDRGALPVRRIQREMGKALPGHYTALGERVGRICAVPCVRPGNKTVIGTTNAIESINARLRRAVNARGHFPTEQAALKCLYLAIMSLDPTGRAESAGPTGGRPP